MLPEVYRRHWRWLIFLHFIQFLATQYMLYSEDIMARRGDESIGLLAATSSLMVSFNLIWYSVFFSLVIQAVSHLRSQEPPNIRETLMHNIQQLLIENLRVLARVIFWIPFFILPALYQYIRLAFVSFVVILDPDYARGNTDALARSKQITRGHALLALTAIIFCLALEPILSGLITAGDGSLWKNPLGALGSAPVSALSETWGVTFLMLIYQSLDPKSVSPLNPLPLVSQSPG